MITLEEIAKIVLVRCEDFDHKFRLKSCLICNPTEDSQP